MSVSMLLLRMTAVDLPVAPSCRRDAVRRGQGRRLVDAGDQAERQEVVPVLVDADRRERSGVRLVVASGSPSRSAGSAASAG